MRIGILGGGITGLTAAHELARKGHDVTLIEKNDTLGGLARGFKENHWDWPLEKAYHHIFASDTDIIKFAKDIGFDGIYFQEPQTNSLYREEDNYRIIPVDSPKDFLLFPYLSMIEKIRAAFFLAIFKFFPHLPVYEHMSAQEFVEKYMGKNMWERFFQQLFRKKFGKYAGKITASFLWARINKRTKALGYMEGGFQAFIDHLVDSCKNVGVDIRAGTTITSIKKKDETYVVDGEEFDSIVTTLPTPILTKVGADIFPKEYLNRLNSLEYLHARVLILETDKPLLNETYWLNICSKDVPMMVLAQHTNFVEPDMYGGNHIAYIGYYLERDDEFMKMSKKELLKMLKPYLQEIAENEFTIKKSYDFKGPFAQPIFNDNLAENKPDFTTPAKNVYVANLDMTYPYDRGTNYAVKLGRKVAGITLQNV